MNFHDVWSRLHRYVDLTKIDSNDIWQIMQHYGVEAGRAAIVKEIRNVFSVYGITVDPRHLGLIADWMTYLGGFENPDESNGNHIIFITSPENYF